MDISKGFSEFRNIYLFKYIVRWYSLTCFLPKEAVGLHCYWSRTITPFFWWQKEQHFVSWNCSGVVLLSCFGVHYYFMHWSLVWQLLSFKPLKITKLHISRGTDLMSVLRLLDPKHGWYTQKSRVQSFKFYVVKRQNRFSNHISIKSQDKVTLKNTSH